VEFIEKASLMSGVDCGAAQFFGREFSWFEKTACVGPLTLFFVDSMADANACAIPGASYVVLTDGANGASVVHEIGHHAQLLHRDDPENIMFAKPSETKDRLTRWQCCLIRSSQFVTARRHCLRVRSLPMRIREIHESHR
jgi:hypothetical protein